MESKKFTIGSEVLSLKDVCLPLIFSNLSRYAAAFSTTKDITLQRNLHFLRKFYSQYLIEKKSDEGKDSEGNKLDENYWDFLINEFLEELNLQSLIKGDWNAILTRIAEVGHAFREVNLRFNVPPKNKEEFQDFVNKIIRYLPKVKVLKFFNSCNDKTLEIIPLCCPELEELQIIFSDVTDDGYKYLYQEKKDGIELKKLRLKRLVLFTFGCNNNSIRLFLENMPFLEVLDAPLIHEVLHDLFKDVAHNVLERTYNLTSIRLEELVDDNKLAYLLSTLINVCPRTKVISLRLETAEPLEFLYKFKELEDLTVGVNSLRVMDLDSLSLAFVDFLKCKGRMLRKLRFNSLHFPPDCLIENCPNLEAMCLESMYFCSLKSSDNLRPLNKLRVLSFQSVDFQFVKMILDCSPSLEELTFCSCEFENAKEIATQTLTGSKNSMLQRLRFICCDIDEALLHSVLLAFPVLKILVINNCETISSFQIDKLNGISSSLKHFVDIYWRMDQPEDDFDDYEVFDKSFEYNHYSKWN